MLIILISILVISFILALFSMGDFEASKEIRRIIKLKSKKGSIVFFKNKVKHYHR